MLEKKYTGTCEQRVPQDISVRKNVVPNINRSTESAGTYFDTHVRRLTVRVNQVPKYRNCMQLRFSVFQSSHYKQAVAVHRTERAAEACSMVSGINGCCTTHDAGLFQCQIDVLCVVLVVQRPAAWYQAPVRTTPAGRMMRASFNVKSVYSV